MIPKIEELKAAHNQATKEYEPYLKHCPEFRLVSFIDAMKKFGFSPVITAAGSPVTSHCEECSQQVYFFLKGGIGFWGCPHCVSVTECDALSAKSITSDNREAFCE